MQMESNIGGVRERLRRYPRDVRTALDRTLDPAAWQEALRQEAARTLYALAGNLQQGFVKPFLNTVMVFAAPLKDGFFARMTNPLPPNLTVQDFAIARGLQGVRTDKGETGPGLWSDYLNQFDALLTEWVATEKRKDKRDWSKSDEEIAQWIGYLMLTPDHLLSNHEERDGRVSELEAKRRLMPHIAEFLNRRQNANRLPDGVAAQWLLAVLAAWSALVRREWRIRFQGHLTAARSEL